MHYPYLALDRSRVEYNLDKMVRKATELDLELRPHFKTHQSKIVGQWFRGKGIKGVTVSSVAMAEYFFMDGWEDITIAFPASILDIKRIDKLCSRIDLNILAVDESSILSFSKGLDHDLGIYLEIDPGYGRSGIPISDHAKLLRMKSLIEESDNLVFRGFYTHAGHSYGCRSEYEIRSMIIPILKKLEELKSAVPGTICFGDTPSCSILTSFGPIDQISPGNFIFYDWTQNKIGSCTPDEIAIAMMCPVVAKYPERNELLIHGGAVHFSKDSFTENELTYYGVVAEKANSDWSKPLPDIKLIKISQEHGTIKCTLDYFESVCVGDIIPILPIHSCLTADCMGEYYDLEGNRIDHLKSAVKRER
jgi:D-serine deaminase-like pyridoxal phosphate-dependent protein